MKKVAIVVGGSIEYDGAAFIDAWHRAEAGQAIDERILSFESAVGLRRYLVRRPHQFHRLLKRLAQGK